jgi:hypothetical protein
MPEYQGNPIVQRLDRLERENWYWKRATLLLLIVIASAIFMGQAGKPFQREAEEIEAQRFVLKDSNGNKLGELGKNAYGHYGFRLFSKDGTYLAGLLVKTDSKDVRLELKDNISASDASLMVSNGVASLFLTGDEQTKEAWERKKEEYRIQYNTAKTEQERDSAMYKSTSHGVEARITVHPKGTSSVALDYGTGTSWRNTIEMSLTKDRQPALHLSDEKGVWRAVLGYTTLERTTTGIVEQRPPSSLVLFDKNGGVIWRAP